VLLSGSAITNGEVQVPQNPLADLPTATPWRSASRKVATPKRRSEQLRLSDELISFSRC
jgi:hypothetical protein